LPLEFAKELDIRNRERAAAGKPVPHDVFTKECYRQPALTEGDVYPEPFRDSSIQMYLVDRSNSLTSNANGYSELESGEGHTQGQGQGQETRPRNRLQRKGSLSLNVAELIDDGEHDPWVMKNYFENVVLPLAHPEDYEIN
jgi:hypothetical protein